MHLKRMCILCFFGCNVLKISIKFNFSIVLFRIFVALLIFCLKGLSIDVSGVLKSPTVNVFLSVSPFMSVSICFIYLGVSMLGAYMLTSVISFPCVDLFIIVQCPFLLKLINLFLAVLGLRFCVRAFSSCSEQGPLFIAVHGPLTIAPSLVAEHRLQTRWLSSCGSRALLLRSMWDLPRPGLEPVSPALAGRL